MVYQKSDAGIFKILIFSPDNTSLVVKIAEKMIISPQAMYYLEKKSKFWNFPHHFLVNHIVKLYTKNQLYATSTAPEKCCVTFFTLKFAYTIFGENCPILLIFGHFFQKNYNFWPFLWWKSIFPMKCTYLAKKNAPQIHFLCDL